MSFKAESYILVKGQVPPFPLQTAPEHLPLVVTSGGCWDSQWEGVGNGSVILNLDVKSAAPVPIYPIYATYPKAGRCQCPGISIGSESGHLGSSSRLPPDSRITLVMLTSLDGFEALIYEIAGLVLCSRYALFSTYIYGN